MARESERMTELSATSMMHSALTLDATFAGEDARAVGIHQ
jgi:hypothetical protein